jgi:threonyl-tRNA synthetase
LLTKDTRKLAKKIRDAEMLKIPYMLIVGENEMNEKKVSVRKQGTGDLGIFSLDEFAEIVQNEINEKLVQLAE